MADRARTLSREETANRIKKFQSLTIAHPLLAAAKEQLIEAIENAPSGAIIMVFGPTGVGKTTLKLKIQQLLLERHHTDLEANRSQIPHLSVEALAPESRNFGWRDYYRRALVEMAEPMVSDKRMPPQMECTSDAHARAILKRNANTGELQHALEMALLHRRPRVVFIDEAQHLARIASGRKLSDQLDVVKSLANRTQTIHILVGTYELLAFRNLSGQLSRRSVDIHFKRYAAENKDDVHIFKNILLTFQNQLSLSEVPDLLQHWDFLYERSGGCIGILKEWLVRALGMAFKTDSASITYRHLNDTALSIHQCEKIALEAREGEERLANGKDSAAKLRGLLGLPTSDSPVAVQSNSSPKAHHRRAGQRCPTRDPVGQVSANIGSVAHAL
jgi:energy-coupling factor transporter ATP-binding protein EcfA2